MNIMKELINSYGVAVSAIVAIGFGGVAVSLTIICCGVVCLHRYIRKLIDSQTYVHFTNKLIQLHSNSGEQLLVNVLISLFHNSALSEGNMRMLSGFYVKTSVSENTRINFICH